MNIKEFLPSTFKFQVPKRGALDSDSLNSFAEAIALDMASISEILNKSIIKPMSTLPDEFTEDSTLDGTSVYIDSDAASNKDNGIFWYENPTKSRPITIYEGFLLFLQIIANIENGLSEGRRFGDVVNKEILSKGDNRYPWNYDDMLFRNELFIETNGQVKPCTLSMYVDSSTHELVINNPGDPVAVWGYVWHPVFTF